MTPKFLRYDEPRKLQVITFSKPIWYLKARPFIVIINNSPILPPAVFKLKNSKDMVLDYFWTKYRIFAILLSPIIPKPLLIYSTVNNTSREVYLRSLTYRAENAPKALFYNVENAFVVSRRHF